MNWPERHQRLERRYGRVACGLDAHTADLHDNRSGSDLHSHMARIPLIETERLVLRAMLKEDAPLLFGYFQDHENSRYWFTPDRTLADASARIVHVKNGWKQDGFGDWAVQDRANNKFIGFVGLHHITGMAEVNLGYLLARSVWGRGYATEACLAALNFGFNSAGLKRIVGVTHPENHASVRVLEKIGMRFWKRITRDDLPRVVYSTDAPPNVHKDAGSLRRPT